MGVVVGGWWWVVGKSPVGALLLHEAPGQILGTVERTRRDGLVARRAGAVRVTVRQFADMLECEVQTRPRRRKIADIDGIVGWIRLESSGQG